MRHPALLATMIAVGASSCSGVSTVSASIGGTYTLVEENGQSLPSDPSAPHGCCLTLSGSLTLTTSTYDLRTSHRNKNNGINFDNAEQGTRSEEHTSELQSRLHLVCRLLLEKKK